MGGILGRAFQVTDAIDPGLVQYAAVFGDVTGGDDYPRKVDKRHGAFGEAAGAAIDAHAAAWRHAEDAGPPALGALYPAVSLRPRQDSIYNEYCALSFVLGQTARGLSASSVGAPGGKVDVRDRPHARMIGLASDSKITPGSIGTSRKDECGFAGAWSYGDEVHSVGLSELFLLREEDE
jgi:hypothetical protein